MNALLQEQNSPKQRPFQNFVRAGFKQLYARKIQRKYFKQIQKKKKTLKRDYFKRTNI